MLEEIKCEVCSATMKSKENLNEDGVCETCVRLYPGAKSPSERTKKKDDEGPENEGRIKNVIAGEVDKILERYGLLIRCECNTLYHKRSPAQKYCGKCSGGKSEAVATTGDKDVKAVKSKGAK